MVHPLLASSGVGSMRSVEGLAIAQCLYGDVRSQRLDDVGRERLGRQFETDIARRIREMEEYERSSVVHPRLKVERPPGVQ